MSNLVNSLPGLSTGDIAPQQPGATVFPPSSGGIPSSQSFTGGAPVGSAFSSMGSSSTLAAMSAWQQSIRSDYQGYPSEYVSLSPEAKNSMQQPIFVNGTDGRDTLSIADQDNGTVDVTLNGTTTSYSAADARRLLFDMGGGNDYVNASKSDILLKLNAGSGNNTVVAGGGGTYIEAGNGRNSITTGDGFDVIRTGNGNNSINVGAGGSIINTGNGNNSITAVSDRNTINTGRGDDRIKITDPNTNATSQSGSALGIMSSFGFGSSFSPVNVINDAGGKNKIAGGNGDFDVNVGGGRTSVKLGDGNNRIFLDAGNNRVTAGDGVNLVKTGSGRDNIRLGNGNNMVYSGAGNDSIRTGNGDSYVEAGRGNDHVRVGNGSNVVYGLDGNDTVRMGSGRNYVDGGSGNDRIISGTGRNVISGGLGDDRINVRRGTNRVIDDAGASGVYSGFNRNNKISAYDSAGNASLGSSVHVNGNDDFKMRVQSDIETMKGLDSGHKLLSELDRSGRQTSVVQIGGRDGFCSYPNVRDDRFVKPDGTRGAGTEPEIGYSPSFSLKQRGDSASLPPIGVLAHEGVHAYNAVTGTMQRGDVSVDGRQVPRREHQAVGLPTDGGVSVKHPDGTVTTGNPAQLSENAFREELGYPKRAAY